MFVSAPSLAAQGSCFCEMEEQEGVLTVVGEAEELTEVLSSIAGGSGGGRAQRVPLDHIRMAQRKNAVNQDVVRRKSLR